MGDSVDNVPGVPGIGPKTAAKLIQQYRRSRSRARRRDQIRSPSCASNLIDHADDARLSRELVRLNCDVALPEPLDELALQGHPRRAVARIPRAIRASSRCSPSCGGGRARRAARRRRSMASWRPWSRSRGPAEPSRSSRPPNYETVTDEAALDRWIAEARAQGCVAVDTETDGIDAMRADLVGVSLATAPNRACYIPLGHGGDDMFAERAEPARRCELVLDEAEAAARGSGVLKIGQNLKYD